MVDFLGNLSDMESIEYILYDDNCHLGAYAENEERVHKNEVTEKLGISQSLNQNTLKNCKLCVFQTRIEEELKIHMEDHPKCAECEIRVENHEELAKHIDHNHNHFQCKVCKQQVAITDTVSHMKMHQTNEQYNKTITDKARKIQPKGWNLFLRTKKALLRQINPNLPHQLATSQVSTLWAELSKAEKKSWNVRALQEQENDGVQEQMAEVARLEEVARLKEVARLEEVARRRRRRTNFIEPD